MTTGIYGIFENEECLYVGQSTDVKVRWYFHRNHLAAGTHHTKDFQEYYTANNPTLEFRILVECPGPELHLMEKLWFDELKPRFWGRLPNLSWRWTEMGEETLKRVRKLKFERKLTRLQNLVDQYEIEAKRLYVDEKQPLTEVGVKLGLSYSDVRNILAKTGVKLRSKRQSTGIERNRDRSMDEIKAELIELRSQDMNWQQIANLWDCGVTSVRGLAIDFGLLIPKPEIPIAQWSDEKLKAAILELESRQLNIGEIAKELRIGKTTLWRRLYKLFPERYESTRDKSIVQ